MSLKLLSQTILFNARCLFLESENLFELLGVKETDRILQIGCSSGYYTRALARIAQDGTVYVIDPCSKALARARFST